MTTMEFTDDPLEYQLSDRGLAYMRPIDTREGARLAVHDSSAAEHDALWFEFTPAIEQPTLDGGYSIAVDVEDALTFAHQIIALARRRGYDADGTQAEADDDVVDGLVAELDAATGRLKAALPEPGPGGRSSAGDILELGAYLATVHTAAALADDLPRRIADLNITAYTTGIGSHLETAARAAQERIRDLALGDQSPSVFPPNPFHITTAAHLLERLHAHALALADRAEAIRTEIECYLDTSTNPEPDSDRAPGCQCTDGNCDKCLHYRQTTESE